MTPSHSALLRARLVDLLEEVGPGAPTLNTGWNSADLAAHLVLRERRPDAALGIAVPPLRGYTKRVQSQLAAKPWADLVEMLRNGPPRWSLFALPGLAESANLVEFFVHTEDVRRAQTPRLTTTVDPALDDALWARTPTAARLVLRSASVRLTLRRLPAHDARSESPKDTSPRRTVATVGKAGPEVTVTGTAPELLLHALGRDVGRPGIVEVSLDGSPDALAAYAAIKRRL